MGEREPWKCGPSGKQPSVFYRVLMGRARSDLPGQRPGVDRVRSPKGDPNCRSRDSRFRYVHCVPIFQVHSWKGRSGQPLLLGAPSPSGLAPEQSGVIPDVERTVRSRERTPPRQREGPRKGAVLRGRSPRRRAWECGRVNPIVLGASLEGTEPRGAGQARACYRALPPTCRSRPSGSYRAPGMGTVTPRGGQ